MKIEDLDVLRPEPRYIRMGGKDIDVSFVPCGITFEIDRIVQELSAMSQEEMLKNGDVTKRAFDLSIDMCVAFCSRKYPEMSRDWFLDNVDALQIKQFSGAIRDALVRAYQGIGGESKNVQAPRRRKK